MTRPPIFDSTADAAEYLAQHDKLSSYLSVSQYARLIEFLAETADGDISLPAILTAFFRGEIERFDEITNGV
jgi:hypothetical protein